MAITLSGTGAYLRSATVPGTISPSTTALTLAVWARVTTGGGGYSGSSAGRILCAMNSTDTDGVMIDTYGDGSYDGETSKGTFASGNTWLAMGSYTANTWTHFAFVTNPSGTAHAFYVNGVLTKSGNGDTGSSPTTGLPASMGNLSYIQIGDGFGCDVQDAIVFSRALSAAEIQQLYGSRTLKVDPTNLLGWWPLAGGSPLIDLGPNNLTLAKTGTVNDATSQAPTSWSFRTYRQPLRIVSSSTAISGSGTNSSAGSGTLSSSTLSGTGAVSSAASGTLTVAVAAAATGAQASAGTLDLYQSGGLPSRFQGTQSFTRSVSIAGTQVHTLTCWVRAATTGTVDANCVQLTNSTGTDTDSSRIGVVDNSGTFSAVFVQHRTGIGSTAVLPAMSGSQWHHLALVVDGTNQVSYIDGAQVDSRAFDPSLRSTGFTTIAIGQNFGGATNPDNAIQDVQVYTSALSAADIKTVIKGSIPAGATLYARWMLQTGAPLQDISGNARPLTQVGTWAGASFAPLYGPGGNNASAASGNAGTGATAISASGALSSAGAATAASAASISAVGATSSAASGTASETAALSGSGTTNASSASSATEAAGLVGSGTTQATANAAATEAASLSGSGTTQGTASATSTEAAGLTASATTNSAAAASSTEVEADTASGTTSSSASASLQLSGSTTASDTTQASAAATTTYALVTSAAGTTSVTAAGSSAETAAISAGDTTQSTASAAVSASAGLVASGTTNAGSAATVGSALAAAGTTSSSASAATTETAALAGSGSTNSTAAASATEAAPLAADATTQATSSSAYSYTLSTTASGTTQGTSSASPSGGASASTQSSAAVTASLSVQETGAGQTSSTAAGALTGAAGLVAAGTTQGTAGASSAESAALVSSGTTQATSAGAMASSAALVGSGTTQATAASLTGEGAFITGSGTTQGAAAAAISGAAALSGAGTTQATASASAAETVALTGSGTTQSAAAASATETAAVTGSGTTQSSAASATSSNLTAAGTTQSAATAAAGSFYAIAGSGNTQTSSASAVSVTQQITASATSQSASAASATEAAPIVSSGTTQSTGTTITLGFVIAAGTTSSSASAASSEAVAITSSSTTSSSSAAAMQFGYVAIGTTGSSSGAAFSFYGLLASGLTRAGGAVSGITQAAQIPASGTTTAGVVWPADLRSTASLAASATTQATAAAPVQVVLSASGTTGSSSSAQVGANTFSGSTRATGAAQVTALFATQAAGQTISASQYVPSVVAQLIPASGTTNATSSTGMTSGLATGFPCRFANPPNQYLYAFLSPAVSSSTLTVSGWFRLDAIDPSIAALGYYDYAPLILLHDYNSQKEVVFGLSVSPAGVVSALVSNHYNSATTQWDNGVESSAVLARWYHLAITSDGSLVTLFVNGSSIGSIPTVKSSYGLIQVIGSYYSFSDDSSLQDLSMYRAALSGQEIFGIKSGIYPSNRDVSAVGRWILRSDLPGYDYSGKSLTLAQGLSSPTSSNYAAYYGPGFTSSSGSASVSFSAQKLVGGATASSGRARFANLRPSPRRAGQSTRSSAAIESRRKVRA